MSAIRLNTDIPGPKSLAIMARRNDVVPRGLYHATPVVAARAEGAIVEDVDGNRFIDLAGGIGTLNVGHSAPAVVAAVRDQLDRFTHTCFSVTAYASYVALAERLIRLTPGAFPKKAMFLNTGAEAVENAVKIARHATGRPGVLVFEDAFHGRTLLALSMTSKVHPYKIGFGPFVGDVHRVPYAYCYRCPLGLEPSSCGLACAGAIEDHFERYVDPASIAAVVVEPVLGEGGFVVPPHGFLKAGGEAFVDLFILDPLPMGRFRRAWKLLRLKTLQGMLKQHTDYGRFSFGKRVLLLGTRALGLLLGRKAKLAAYDRIARKGGPSPLLHMSDGAFNLLTMAFAADTFDSPLPAALGPLTVRIPRDAAKVLTMLYGSDYMTPPPESARKPLHLDR